MGLIDTESALKELIEVSGGKSSSDAVHKKACVEPMQSKILSAAEDLFRESCKLDLARLLEIWSVDPKLQPKVDFMAKFAENLRKWNDKVVAPCSAGEAEAATLTPAPD